MKNEINLLHSKIKEQELLIKALRDQEKILLISAITQIVFLDFKEYAVINCSVEIAKKLNIECTYINATHSILYELANPKKTIKDLADNLY